MRPVRLTFRSLRWMPAALPLLIGIAGCAGSGGEREQPANYSYDSTETLPVPPEIRDNVDFWRHVYGVWGRNDVAIHDDLYMGVIYEVVKLPGGASDGYSESQKALLKARAADYAARLRGLQRRVSSGQSLSPADKQLLAKFDQVGGTAALAGADERVRTQRGLRERFRRGLEISGRYDEYFREIMRRHGVPEDLAYLPHVESSFQTNARSKVGAGGVWQFMPATGRMFMTVNGTVDERYDPILAADGAARYLSQAHDRLGSWPLAITSYNHGQGGMAKARAQYGDDIGRIVKRYDGRGFGFASRNFYAEFIAAREVARTPKTYFPEGLHYLEPWPYDRLVLRDSMPAAHVARHYGVASSQLGDLNLHWGDRARDSRAYLPAGSTVWLPEGSLRRVASHPPPVPEPVMVAQTTPRPAVTRASTSKVALAKASTPAPKAAAAKQSRVSTARYHVVKPKETLYRVAVQNGLTVDELRKLNRMRADDNTIRPGQKLKVGI